MSEEPKEKIVEPVKPVEQEEPKEPKWLPHRLEQQTRSVLKGIGVESADEAKSLIDEARKIKAEKLSAEEKMRAEIDGLKASTGRLSKLETLVKDRAEHELTSLTDAQRNSVLKLAGDDHGEQLRFITELKSTWAVMATATTTSLPATATTISSAPAPKATPSLTENHKATYESLKLADPFRAGIYLQENRAAIYGRA